MYLSHVGTGDMVTIINHVLGIWFHAMQLSTTFIPSRNFVYLLQCSAVDIQTHSFTIQTVPASLPAVGQNCPMLTHFFFSLVMIELIRKKGQKQGKLRKKP